jgi:tetratricopeptide (TPR) repeat protein
LWIVVILLGFVALGWRIWISSFAGNVGLLLLARSLSSSDPVGPESIASYATARERARQWLQLATQLNRENAGAWRGQGFSLAAEGQEQAAAAAWQAAGITSQEFIQRGEAARLAGYYLEALAWYERAEKLEPSLPGSVLYYRFLAQRALGSTDFAFDSLRRAVTSDQGWSNPELRFRAWHTWGLWLTERHRGAEAEVALLKAIAVCPADPPLRPVLAETYRYLGLAQWSQNRLEQATQSLSMAVQLDEQNVWAHIHYGKVLFLRDPSKAPETAEQFAVALRLRPSNVDLWKNLIEFWQHANALNYARALCIQAQTQGLASGLAEVCTKP